MTKQPCARCEAQTDSQRTAYFSGKYLNPLCDNCAAAIRTDYSSQAASHNRRRQYEDYAQDTIQPYDANGKPNAEFARLYPDTAKKMFNKRQMDDIRRKL